ncbi:MAG: GGDEF domain-containing protein, partial [Candidatus Thermochlorobacter sp.]
STVSREKMMPQERLTRLIEDCEKLRKKALMSSEALALLERHRADLYALLDYYNTQANHAANINNEDDQNLILELQEMRAELQLANEALQFLDKQKTDLMAELEHQRQAFEQQSREDGLTKLYNRRYIDTLLAQEFERSKRFKHPFTIGIIDIDHFKNINDTFSHQVGDEVIRTVAQIFKNNLRSMDLVGRYGGEEFVIGLLETSLMRAVLVAEKLRRAVEEFNWIVVKPELRVTVSIGLAEDTKMPNHEKMISEADKKLYEAKRSGRNLVRY